MHFNASIFDIVVNAIYYGSLFGDHLQIKNEMYLEWSFIKKGAWHSQVPLGRPVSPKTFTYNF